MSAQVESSSSAGTTSWTSPNSSRVAAVSVSAVKKYRRAALSPILPRTKGEITAGMIPRRTSVKSNFAVSTATTMSQAPSSPSAPPYPSPLTRASVGFGMESSNASIAASCSASARLAASPACTWACISVRSAPAEKTPPAPVICTRRTAPLPAQACSSELSAAMVARSKALRFSGRLSVISATPPAIVVRTDALIGIRGRGGSHQFDGDRRRFTAADAQAGDAALLAARTQGIQQRSHDARPGRADRMAERTGSAVDIHLLMIQAQVLHRGHGHGRKRLVDLVQVDVLGLPIQLPQQFLHGAHGRQSEPFRLAREAGVAQDACQGFAALRCCEGFARQYQCRCTVGNPGGTGGGHRPVLLERRLERGNLGDIESKRRFVLVDDDFALAGLGRHRSDLGGEAAAGDSRQRPAHRLGGEIVLGFAEI